MLSTSSKSKRKRKTLDDILSGPDKYGLLDVTAQAPTDTNNATNHTAFIEIVAFVDKHKRLPKDCDSVSFSERQYARRLVGFQAHHKKLGSADPLLAYDTHGLLTGGKASSSYVEQPLTNPNPVADTPSKNASASNKEKKRTAAPTSFDDILGSSLLDSLTKDTEPDLFTMRHVTPEKENDDRARPDHVAQRKPCADFYEFESLFAELREKLKTGEAETARFTMTSSINEGDFLIVEGVTALVDKIGEYREDGQGRYDPRLRLIFENGTESDHLLQSLAKLLYTDPNGRRIIGTVKSVEDNFKNITHRDKRAGYVYFLRSLTDNPTLLDVPNLIKIGYTEGDVKKRIAGAHNHATFLEAPVEILAITECYNVNPKRFEALIHAFLHAQRVNMTLIGKNGKHYRPREWFSVPLDTAREVVRRIIDGSITQYRMDNTVGKLVKKA